MPCSTAALRMWEVLYIHSSGTPIGAPQFYVSHQGIYALTHHCCVFVFYRHRSFTMALYPSVERK
jgi:Golgi nucleoside diphosphatase